MVSIYSSKLYVFFVLSVILLVTSSVVFDTSSILILLLNTSLANTKFVLSIKKQVIISLCMILMILALVLFGIYANKQKQKKINEENLANYQDYMNDAAMKMIEGAAQAEYCGNLIKEVWSDTINEEHYNSSTSKYIKTKYGYTSDFNTSLNTLLEDEDFSKKIILIKNNREDVDEIMKKLINPSEEHKEAYATLKEYYDNYYSLTELAISPTGSLTTYSSNFNQADTDTVKSYNKMKKYLNN